MSLLGLSVSLLLLPRASSHVLSLQKAVPLEECSDQRSHDLSYRKNFLRTKHPPVWSPLGAVSAVFCLGVQIALTHKMVRCKCFFITHPSS